jgi:type VI secretion system protein ImpH
MAAAGRHADHPLKEQLREDYQTFDWYQLVRLLLMERVGQRATVEPESHVRFRADLSLAFPGTEVTDVVDPGGGVPVCVTTRNYGVAGYLGPLPEAFTERLYERRAQGERAMVDFLDIFNNRLGHLRFRTKARSCPALTPGPPQETLLAGPLSAVMGLAAAELAEQVPLPTRAVLGLAGLLANRRRSADAIQRVLACYLGVDVTLRQFVGAWQPIPESDCLCLAKKNSSLGSNTVLGEKVWDAAAAIEVRVGPLAREPLLELLPGGARHQPFAAMLRFLTDRQADCRVRLVADAGAIPGARIISLGAGVSRLGYVAWLGDAQIGYREAVFTVPAYAAEADNASPQ